MKKLTLLLALMVILFSCKPEVEKPTVVTKSVGEVTETTAKVVGQVTADGGAEVTERGVCWNTAPAPEVIDYRTVDGTGIGTFNSNISDLVPNTQYYVRAYATNEKGTAYGEEVSFTTEEPEGPENPEEPVDPENPEQPVGPVVTTAEVTEITVSSAVSGGEVVSGGNAVVVARGVCWNTTGAPTVSDTYTMDGTNVGVFTSGLSNLESNTAYYVRAYATDAKGVTSYGEEVTFTTLEGTFENGHEYVDLGLSVKWATCNVGATSPEEYGDYYAWGETTTKETYTEANCATYNVSMNDISGNAQYDAATANWGGTWRMPTYDELKELRTKCTWTWITQNGINGYNVEGPNGNSIFLPAAGRYGSSLINAGSDGYYWSSTPFENGDGYAYLLFFGSGSRDMGYYYRYYGHSVRPVLE